MTPQVSWSWAGLVLLPAIAGMAVAAARQDDPPPAAERPPAAPTSGQIGPLEDDGRPPAAAPTDAAGRPFVETTHRMPLAPDAAPRPLAGAAAADASGNASANLPGWAERLAAQSDQFYRAFAATGGTVPQASSILYEAQNLRAAALVLRQAAARSADDPQARAAALQAIAWWQNLAARVQAMAGGRVGPNVQLVLAMGETCEQIRLLVADPGPAPAATATAAATMNTVPVAQPASAGAPYPGPPPGAFGVPVARPRPVRVVPNLLGRLRRPR